MISLGWSWDACRNDLDLPRLRALNNQWADIPPLHVSVKYIAMAAGVEFTGGRRGDDSDVDRSLETDVPDGALKIAELRSGAPDVVPGGDTAAASRAIVEQLMRAGKDG